MILRSPFDPQWMLRSSAWEPQRNQVWESLTTLANGYVGVRGSPDEPFDAGPTLGGIYIAGVFDPGADGIAELVNVPNFLAVEVLLDGRPFHLTPQNVTQYTQTLDLKRGVLQRCVVCRDGGRSTRVEFERFASMAHRHVVGQAISVTPLDWRGVVTVRLWLDANVRNRQAAHLRLLHAEQMGRDRLLMVTQTLASQIRIGQACRCWAWVREAQPPRPMRVTAPGKLGLEYQCHLEMGQLAFFSRATASFTSRDHDTVSVERSCLQEVRDPERSTYGVRRRNHVRYWRRCWARSDIAIEGPQEDQRALRFAIFHLLQSCPLHDDTVSIGAKGLSGEGYRGHVFWDTEIFMLPFFLWSAPTQARRLLLYRVQRLEGARHKAAAGGYKGAMFPWESADSGEEACPLFITMPATGERVAVATGRLEQHITADVVYGAWRYVQATSDRSFRERQLLRLAVETARFWASRVEESKEGDAVIRKVIGPDEYHEAVDNNAFTNFMAAWNLRLAADEVTWIAKVHRKSSVLRFLRISPHEPAAWRDAAKRLRILTGPDGLIEEHEGFFGLRHEDPAYLRFGGPVAPEAKRLKLIQQSQVVKQADVIQLLGLFPSLFPAAVAQRNWDYYEPRTAHDSSLSASMHSIVASDIGDRAAAYAYFQRSARVDLNDLMGNSADGLHLAAIGGTLQAVVRGVLGLILDGGVLRLRPQMPASWKALSMRVRYQKRWYSVHVTGDSATLLPLTAEERFAQAGAGHGG